MNEAAQAPPDADVVEDEPEQLALQAASAPVPPKAAAVPRPRPSAPAQTIESTARITACTEGFLKATEIAGDLACGDQALIRSEAASHDNAVLQAILALVMHEAGHKPTGRIFALRDEALIDELCAAVAEIRRHGG